MHLLVVVINEEDRVERVLSGFLELGVTGATLIRTEGMGRVLTQDMPAFAGLQALIHRSRPQNTTVFSVIETTEQLEAAIQVVLDVLGDLSSPGNGILFTLPVDRVIGLARRLAEEDVGGG